MYLALQLTARETLAFGLLREPQNDLKIRLRQFYYQYNPLYRFTSQVLGRELHSRPTPPSYITFASPITSIPRSDSASDTALANAGTFGLSP